MKTSDKGINLIKSFEGLRLSAYKPISTEKYYTIGYGHYGEDVKPNDRITKEMAETLLKEDLQKFESGVYRALKYNAICQHKFDALVSFAYNVGLANFAKSTLLKKVLANPYDKTIKDEFMKWVFAGGKKLDGLVKRRNAESELYFG